MHVHSNLVRVYYIIMNVYIYCLGSPMINLLVGSGSGSSFLVTGINIFVVGLWLVDHRLDVAFREYVVWRAFRALIQES